MPPSLFSSYITQPLTLGGSETTVYVNAIKTATGETLTWAEFSPFTRGILVVDPEGIYNTPEIISFTGVDTTNIAFTGCVRGLSTVGSGTVTANKVFHGTNAPVIISWGAQNISDLITYMQSLVAGTAGSATDATSGLTKMSETPTASNPRAMSAIVQQQGTPGLTLQVLPFTISGTSTDFVYAGGASPSFSNPATNPRIDLLVYEPSSSTLKVRQGTEAVSPSKPVPTSGDVVLAEVFNRHGETSIKERDDSTNGYIMHWYTPQVYRSDVQAFAADASGSTTTYVITPSPAISSYYTGLPIRFTPQATNTGASTINVNGLGAKSIVKNQATALAAGDLVAGQMIDLSYDGTNFQIVSPTGGVPFIKTSNINTAKDMSEASVATTYAHGLGIVPKKVNIVASLVAAGTPPTSCLSIGTYDSSGQNCVETIIAGTNSSNNRPAKGVQLDTTTVGNAQQTGVVSVDATNITITWTKAGSPTGIASVVIDVFA